VAAQCKQRSGVGGLLPVLQPLVPMMDVQVPRHPRLPGCTSTQLSYRHVYDPLDHHRVVRTCRCTYPSEAINWSDTTLSGLSAMHKRGKIAPAEGRTQDLPLLPSPFRCFSFQVFSLLGKGRSDPLSYKRAGSPRRTTFCMRYVGRRPIIYIPYQPPNVIPCPTPRPVGGRRLVRSGGGGFVCVLRRWSHPSD
jgi:hypothetical protein